MITVFTPTADGPTQIVDRDGKAYNARIHEGHLVIDLPLKLFQSQLMGLQSLLWQRANPKACEYLGKHGFDNIINGPVFPDAGRPAPVAPVNAEAPPRIVRLVAPDGVTSFSHNGEQFTIGKDRMIEVDDALAETLKSHGFKVAA